MNVIVIEDEKPAARRLKRMLQKPLTNEKIIPIRFQV